MKILIFFCGGRQKIAGSDMIHEGHDGEIDGLGSKIGPNYGSKKWTALKYADVLIPT